MKPQYIFSLAILLSAVNCQKSALPTTDSTSNSQQRLAYEFNPSNMTEAEISKSINNFISSYENDTLDSIEGSKAVWLIEASANYWFGDASSIDILLDSIDTIRVSTNDHFSASQISEYTSRISGRIGAIRSSITLDSDSVVIGLVDLRLKDDNIEMAILLGRQLRIDYGATKWLCHSATEYPWSSTVVLSNGIPTMIPDFYCSNASADNHGVNHFMRKRLNSHFRGYECKPYSHSDPVSIPCDGVDYFIHTIGYWVNSGTSTNWGNGCYSVSYPYLMPHSGVSNWSITHPCHNGTAIRCITDTRIYPWIQNRMNTYYPGYQPIYSNVWRPAQASQNSDNVMSLAVYIGKCTYNADH